MNTQQYQRGAILYAQGRWAEAEREFRGAIGERPGEGRGHSMLALCLARLMKFREAEEEADVAIGLEPDDAFVHYAMGIVLFERRRYGDAAAAALRAVEVDPRDANHWGLLGQVRLAQRDWAGAVAAADKGLEVDAEHDGCVNVRAAGLVHLGRRAEAASVMEGALGRDPENARTHANRGWGLLHEGRPKEAMVHFREALRLEPGMEWARAGIVESMKAHNPVYRGMLAYFLWMARLGGRARWAIVIGGYVGARALRGAADARPALAPWVTPIVVAYVVFALMTWLSVPLFNLFLRVSRFGRYALSRDQTIGSTVFGVELLLALAAAGVWLARHDDRFCLLAVILGLMLIPLATVWAVARGWPRWTAAGVTAALYLVGLIIVGIVFDVPAVGWMVSPSTGGPVGAVGRMSDVFLVGLLGSQFLSNYLATVQVRR